MSKEPEIRFYSYPTDKCSCRNSKGVLTPIGERYPEYYNLVTKNGLSGIEALKKMKIERMCCRLRFLNLVIAPMIERSKDRYINENEGIHLSTRELNPEFLPPNFPSIPGQQGKGEIDDLI